MSITFVKSNQFSMLIQSNHIDFGGWHEVETSLILVFFPVGWPLKLEFLFKWDNHSKHSHLDFSDRFNKNV